MTFSSFTVLMVGHSRLSTSAGLCTTNWLHAGQSSYARTLLSAGRSAVPYDTTLVSAGRRDVGPYTITMLIDGWSPLCLI